MEIKVLEQEDNRIKFALEGAGHTFCNNLKHQLYSDDSVQVAAYKVDHPLVSTPTFIIQKKGNKKLATILTDVAKGIKEDNKAFSKALSKL